MTELVALSSFEELKAHDGQQVVIEGTYAKRMSQRKMNDPKLYFFGFVDIQVDGGTVQLSGFRRDEAEVAQFEDKRVRVRGTLVLDRGAGAEYARPEPKPTLVDPAELVLAD
ncbi:MAG: hypothetical protein KC912_04050 [Proteobacteria bacterium]|nr:hypothetical protein [Pseudomonadota bacterium]